MALDSVDAIDSKNSFLGISIHHDYLQVFSVFEEKDFILIKFTLSSLSFTPSTSPTFDVVQIAVGKKTTIFVLTSDEWRRGRKKLGY